MDLGWRADGIARALAAGGRELEVYQRPGFTGGAAVRVVPREAFALSGFDSGYWPDDEAEADPTPERFRARRR